MPAMHMLVLRRSHAVTEGFLSCSLYHCSRGPIPLQVLPGSAFQDVLSHDGHLSMVAQGSRPPMCASSSTPTSPWRARSVFSSAPWT